MTPSKQPKIAEENSLDSVRNLPFATYDLAVYLPGGAVLLLIIQTILTPFFSPTTLPTFIETGDKSVDTLLKGVFWLSLCYLTGHLGSFISTYSVERMVHDVLGFPSDNWIEREKYVTNGVQDKKATTKIIKQNISRYRPNFSSLIVILFQSALFLPLVIFFIFKPIGFYSTKLPDGISLDLSIKYNKLKCSVPLEKNTRWNKIIEHYVANNCPEAYVRMYNYLVIYGALRLLSLILLITCWGILIHDASYKINGNWNIDLKTNLMYFSATFSCFLSMMAFAKFNRRYFEESILAFLLAPHNVSDIRK
jgi:hypothetical protein